MEQNEYRIFQVFQYLCLDWNNEKIREEYRPRIKEMLDDGWSVPEVVRRMRMALSND